jgi:hypothetical protein
VLSELPNQRMRAATLAQNGPTRLRASSLVTDGEWLWRQDLSHHLAMHHVVLPEEFLTRVREFADEVPALVAREFGPRFDATLPVIGWTGLSPRPQDVIIDG